MLIHNVDIIGGTALDLLQKKCTKVMTSPLYGENRETLGTYTFDRYSVSGVHVQCILIIIVHLQCMFLKLLLTFKDVHCTGLKYVLVHAHCTL